MEHDGFNYKSNGVKNNVHYYICSCSNVTCKATIKRKNDGSIVLGTPHTHDSSINEERITKINFRKALVDRAANETTLLKIIYDEEAIRNPDAANIYTWPTAESSMRRARRKNCPVLPATLNALGETLDENQNLVKCNNHQFYQECIVDDLGKCHIMFACPEVVNRVELNGGEIEMHADATFKVVPSIPKCYQLFIIHTIIQNHSIPICYVLMESKTQVAYEKVITQFNRIFPNIQPSIIMTDYEIGLRNAFRKVYPNADMVSCWFHYVQSLWKNIKKLNFTTYIRNNETAKMCVKMVMVLALLPANEIDTGFQEIKNHARMNNINLTRFFNYYSRHWLIRTGPTVFSVYGQARRTNNNVESFHNKLKDKFQVCHPNLWKVLGHLSDCSKLQHIVIDQLARGMQVTRSIKNKYILNSKRIKMATDQLTLGIITRKEFLIKCSHAVDGYILREGNWTRHFENNDNNTAETSSEDENIVLPMPVQQVPPNDENIDNNTAETSSEEENIVLPMPVQQVPPNDENIDNNTAETSSEEENIVLPMPVQQVPPNDENIDVDNLNMSNNIDFRDIREIHIANQQDYLIMEQERIEQLNNLPFAPVPEILPLIPLISQNVCAICRSSRSTHALIPCGHRALCEGCKGLLEQQRCPICAQPFFSILRIWDT